MADIFFFFPPLLCWWSMFCLRLIFSFLLKPWADNGLTDQYSCELFYGQEMAYLMPSYLKSAYCGRGVWCDSLSLWVSLLSDECFLTDIKHIAKSYQGGTLSVPCWCLCQKLPLSLLYFNKNFVTQRLQVIKHHLWPWIEFLSSRGHESQHSTQLTE